MSDPNPYAAPVPVDDDPVDPRPTKKFWRDGDCVVVNLKTSWTLTRKCELPKVCLVTGEPSANRMLKQTFSTWANSIQLAYYLSEASYRERSQQRLKAWGSVGMGFLVAGLGLIFLESFYSGSTPLQIAAVLFIPIGILIMIPGAYRLQRQNEPLKLVMVDEDQAWFGRASEAFLDRVAELETENE